MCIKHLPFFVLLVQWLPVFYFLWNWWKRSCRFISHQRLPRSSICLQWQNTQRYSNQLCN